jgi:hypothetical protein
MTPKERAENYMKLKEGYMTPKERAELLWNKYSKEYLISVVKSYKTREEKEHWIEVANELNKLYKNEKI